MENSSRYRVFFKNFDFWKTHPIENFSFYMYRILTYWLSHPDKFWMTFPGRVSQKSDLVLARKFAKMVEIHSLSSIMNLSSDSKKDLTGLVWEWFRGKDSIQSSLLYLEQFMVFSWSVFCLRHCLRHSCPAIFTLKFWLIFKNK